MEHFKNKTKNSLSFIISIIALAVACASFYFQFFHVNLSIIAYMNTFEIGDRSSIEYTLINNGDRQVLLFSVKAREPKKKKVASKSLPKWLVPEWLPETTEVRPADADKDDIFPLVLKPGEFHQIRVPVYSSFEGDKPSNWQTIHVVFVLLDPYARRHEVIDKLKVLNQTTGIFPIFDVKRNGISILDDKLEPLKLL